ncbi:MAG: sporulation protein YqfD [Eubacteriales bacterium]|nr:sporulation protein YqfD [Eubacteriales bacterium]
MLWNYLCGYVIIQIEGLGLERFINRMLEAGLPIWGIRREDGGAMTASVSIAGFYALRRLIRSEGWSVRIREKHGLLFRLSRLRRRKVLLYGWAPTLMALLCLSRMIWIIDITGCDAVKEETVRQAIHAQGVYPGVARRGHTVETLQSAVEASDARISMASVTISGVVMRVEVREAEPGPAVQDDSVPAHVVARRDGVILSVTALKGHAVVKEGQLVRAGDMLISGDLTREGGEPLFVHARGQVLAETVYTADVTHALGETALQTAAKRAMDEVDTAAAIVEKSSRTILLPDGNVRAVVVVTAREDIGKTKELE